MFIDSHLHTVLHKGLPRTAGGNFATPEELIKMMDLTGVDKGILLPSTGVECGFQRVTNEEILEVVSQYPDRFYSFCNIDPRSGSNAPDADLSYHLCFMERFNERILFGTDICDPSNDHLHAAYLRQSLAEGHLSEATFENISWRNANRLFKLGL